MADVRKCAGSQRFNTGTSKCSFNPDKIKGIILVAHGYKLPAKLSANDLLKACHADRPNRLYPIKGIVEYAPSGGEAQVNAVGYGPNKISGYSARTDTFTLDKQDIALRSNLVKAKDIQFDMYLYDANNVIYGVKDNTEELAGIELSGISPGGQDFDSSSTEANLTVNVMIKDVEKYLKNADIKIADFDIESALEGLTYVEFKLVEANKYMLVEHEGGLDVTEYYGEIIQSKAAEVLDGASAAQYKDGLLTITTQGSTTPKLKAASTLFENDIIGIEQYV